MKAPRIVAQAAAEPYVNPLVKALVDDPGNPPDLVAIRGYIGPADVAGVTRVYLNPLMSVWRDVPDADVLQRAHVDPNPNAPFGEDVVWVTRRAARRIPEERTASVIRDDLVQLAALQEVVAARPVPGQRPGEAGDGQPAGPGCPFCGSVRRGPGAAPYGGPTGEHIWPP